MNNRILLTGITGFIGRNVARSLAAKKLDFTAIVRPGTSSSKLKVLPKGSEVIKLDLSQTDKLQNYLESEHFDTIIHVGALRGGRRYPQKTYYDTNVKATEQMILHCMKNDAKLLFCSSVGVYGAIPRELPANINTEYQEDNYYHITKIRAEALIRKYSLSGLKGIIIRPAITYGEGDYGFPYKLVKMVHRKLLWLPDVKIRIHLAHIDVVADVFSKLAEEEFRGNKIYNIADQYPVELDELVDFISNRIRKKTYPENRFISARYFRKMSDFCLRYGFSEMYNKLQLISHSWFYDSSEIYSDLSLKQKRTIPDFKTVVDWYKKKHKIK